MKKLILLSALLIFACSYGQSNYSKDALRLCSVLQSNNFGTDSDAENALDKILNVIGASKRFVLQPCSNIDNAVATSYKGIRYILYDREFMNSINYGNNWGNIFVLAHEVGHHINGHSLDLVLYAADAIEPQSLAQSRQDELEADEFAGFVLAKLGGPLSAANNSITSISSNRDDTYSTHPNRDKRLNAVLRGYNKSKTQQNFKKSESKKGIAEEYFYKGLKKFDEEDINGAVSDYTVAISLDPTLTVALNNRAMIFMEKGLFREALDDMNLAIKHSPNDAQFFDNRARIKMNLAKTANDKLLLEAIGDLTSSLSLEPNSYRYFQRGMVKYRYFGWTSACVDFNKAKDLGEDLPHYILSNLNEYGCE